MDQAKIIKSISEITRAEWILYHSIVIIFAVSLILY